jgi:hypothetical protein
VDGEYNVEERTSQTTLIEVVKITGTCSCIIALLVCPEGGVVGGGGLDTNPIQIRRQKQKSTGQKHRTDHPVKYLRH